MFSLLVGCQSIAVEHGNRLRSVNRARDGIVEVSKKLDDIAQTMLYAGRIHDAPLADLALDVAIAIHGEPDDGEKAYAQALTPEAIERDRISVEKLLAKRNSLRAFIAEEGKKLDSDIAKLVKIEAEYVFLRALPWKFAIGIGGIVLVFLRGRLFLR
jgi:hypothetical protein